MRTTKYSPMMVVAATLMLALAQAATASVLATGGATTVTNGCRIHTFTTVGTTNLAVIAGGDIEVLVVAGGGGGGGGLAGGGGAGGLIYSSAFTVVSGSNYVVTVGAGGAGAGTSDAAGVAGSNSVFGPLIAIGGGRGSGQTLGAPSVGGSGGGASVQIGVQGAAGTNGQGKAGGYGTQASTNYGGGGGGGAGSVGTNGTATIGGAGGNGTNLPQFASAGGDTNYPGEGWFAGGGGGGTYQGGTAGNGGKGGGGKSGAPGANNRGLAGQPNTGGGGGSGTYQTTFGGGGTGGCGIVVVICRLNPSVENSSALLTGSGATLNGYLVSTGDAANVSAAVFWGPTDGAANLGGWANTNWFPGWSVVGPLSTNVTPTVAGARHYYRFYASNSFGSAWAPSSGRFTPPGAPFVNNGGGAANIRPLSATLQGEVTGGNPAPYVWIYWGTENQGTDKTLWEHVSPVGVVSDATFSASIGNLVPSQMYWYACYASNSHGEAWAVATNFTCLPARYVKEGGNDADTGADWDHAWGTISNALTNAVANDVIVVSNGTYYVTTEIVVNKAVTISGFPPNTNTIVTRASTATNRIFRIMHDSAVVEYLTITNGNNNLSDSRGWQLGGGGAINMSGGTLRNCLIEKNRFIVWGLGAAMHLSGNSTVSNCLIRNNTFVETAYGAGIAIWNNGANVRVVDCVIRDNGGSTAYGGGIYMQNGTIERCTIQNNNGGGEGGGGVDMVGGVVKDCTLDANNCIGTSKGGGILLAGGMVSNCIIANGTSGVRSGGGGVYMTAGQVVDCTITNNKYTGWQCYEGAGVWMNGGTVRNTLIAGNVLYAYNTWGAGVHMEGGQLVSCTIANNSCDLLQTAGGDGLGMVGGGIHYEGGSITNCIIYGNTTQRAGDDDNLNGVNVTNACWYSCSPGLTNAANFNITNNPLFAVDGSYRLQSKGGRWTPSGWVNDMQTSPCIDKGPPPPWPYAQESSPNGSRVNMGYDANTPRASKTPVTTGGTVLLLR